jgi:hypothetical protein
MKIVANIGEAAAKLLGPTMEYFGEGIKTFAKKRLEIYSTVIFVSSTNSRSSAPAPDQKIPSPAAINARLAAKEHLDRLLDAVRVRTRAKPARRHRPSRSEMFLDL